MSKFPLALVLVGLLGGACGETVPLNDHNQAGEGGMSSVAEGGSANAEGGSANAEGGAATAGGEADTGGTVSGGTAGSGGTSENSAGMAASDGGNGAAGANSDDGPHYPPICVTSPDGPVVGGSRLKALCVSASDGSQLLRRGKLFDSELMTECSYRTAGDGSWRCLPPLPADSLALYGYSDAKCTKRVMWLDPAKGGCAPTPPKYEYYLDTAPYCGFQSESQYQTHVFPVGSVIAPPSPLYAKHGATCEASSAPIDKVYFTIGDEIPPADFVAGTRAVAP